MSQMNPICDAVRSLCRATVFGVLVAVVLIFSRLAIAGGGAEGVAVVVNADSWASLAVANEYVSLRRIPETNVIYLEGLPGGLGIGVDDFRARILRPVLETLAARGVKGSITIGILASAASPSQNFQL